MQKRTRQDVSGLMPDNFDRLLGQLEGLPDIVKSALVTVRDVPLFGVGGASTFIVQTIRQREQGDYIFLEVVNVSGTVRLVLPPKVVNLILRQHDQLITKNRRKMGKAAMEKRIADGFVPTFKKGAGGNK